MNLMFTLSLPYLIGGARRLLDAELVIGMSLLAAQRDTHIAS
jgi:hypothetical protein